MEPNKKHSKNLNEERPYPRGANVNLDIIVVSINIFCKLPFTDGVHPPEFISLNKVFVTNLLNINLRTSGCILLLVIFPTNEHNIFFSLNDFFGKLMRILLLS